MDWIKRNLFFVIGAVIALLLLVGAGFYTWSAWQQKAKILEELNQKYADLKNLMNANPHPGSGKVDNIQAAKDQLKQVQGVIGELHRRFEPIPAIPEGGTNVTVQAFAARLARTLYDLQREATNAGVVLLQPKYEFSFKQQNQAVRFAPGSVGPLAVQLGEVKALSDLLIASRINSLESIQRERVSPDDLVGQQTDYIEKRSETNELAILTPYQITFRSFTPELAQVLCGFANSPHGIIIKSINVEPATASAFEAAVPPPVTYYAPPVAAPVPTFPVPRYAAEESKAFAERYGTAGKFPTPAPIVAAPAPVMAAPVNTAPRTVLNEKQLKVTMLVHIVKPLPKN